MIKPKFFICTFFCVLFAGNVVSQQIDSLPHAIKLDSLSHKYFLLDTLKSAFRFPTTLGLPENYQSELLGRIVPFYDIFISRYQETNFKEINAQNYRFEIGGFQNLLKYSSNNLTLDTGKSISRLSLMLGTKREQLLFLDHKQRIGKSVKLDISYNSIVSEGFLLHQFGKVKNFKADLSFTKGWYSLNPIFESHKIEAEENGGIRPVEKTGELTKSDYELLDINLRNAQSNLKQQKISLLQRFRVVKGNFQGESSGDGGFFLDVFSKYELKGFSYTDLNDTNYYTYSFADPLLTFDSSSVRDFNNYWGFAYRLNEDKKTSEISIGVDRHDIDQKIDSLKTAFNYYSPNIKVSFSDHKTEIEGKASYIISKDVKKSDFSILLSGKRSFKNEWFNLASVKFLSASLDPAYTSNFYLSNHFRWNNFFSEKEKMNALSMGVSLIKEYFSATTTFTDYQNKIYFDENALPNQYHDHLLLMQHELKGEFQFGKIKVTATSVFQNSSSRVVKVPSTSLYGRISYRNNFFKKALKAEFGISGVYIAAYNGDAYMPATGQYYLQEQQEIGGATTVSIFTNLQIGTAVIFLKLENVNHGIFGGENYLVPSYPAPPRTLKFGLIWTLRN